MKTKQEILDFYGVEIGKKYRITYSISKLSTKLVGRIFQIGETEHYLKIMSESGEYFSCDIDILNVCNYEEVEPPILDNKEREFLQKYVMYNPAFKGKVKYITKTYLSSKKTEYIEITTTKYDDDFACFPCFEQDTMYKGMEIGKNYTPKELGLEE